MVMLRKRHLYLALFALLLAPLDAKAFTTAPAAAPDGHIPHNNRDGQPIPAGVSPDDHLTSDIQTPTPTPSDEPHLDTSHPSLTPQPSKQQHPLPRLPATSIPNTALIIVDMQQCFMPGGQLPVPGGHAVVPAINRLRAQAHFPTVVLTQDWHPRRHISFASTHPGAAVGDSRTFQYRSDGRLCSEPGLPSSLASAAVRCPSRPKDHITLLPQQLWPEHCIQDTPLVALHPLLATSPHDLLIHKGWKQHIDAYSAFFDNGRLQQTGLHSRLSQGDNITRVLVVGVALDYCVKYTALDAAELGYETWLVREATAGVEQGGSEAAVQEMVAQGVKVVGTVQEALQMLADTWAGKEGASKYSKPAVTLTAAAAAAGDGAAASSQVGGASRGRQQGAAARTEL